MNFLVLAIFTCFCLGADAMNVIRFKVPSKTVPQIHPDMFSTKKWTQIQSLLDQTPTFVVVDPDGKPVLNRKYNIPFFYCDVEDALKVLGRAQRKTNLDGFDVVPFPMGEAFQLWCHTKCMIIPSQKAVVDAGGSSNTNCVGQQIPLFGCLDIVDSSNGKEKVPLFMSLEDATKAVQRLNECELEKHDNALVCLSLSGAVEHLATFPEATGFSFITPSSSRQYIAKHCSK